MSRQITGYHVLAGFVLAFSVIISVNLLLAFNAVRSFPGLEVKNSYVASQKFEAARAAQLALQWDVAAKVRQGALWLTIERDGNPVQAQIDRAVFGRATYAGADQHPEFVWTGAAFTAPVKVTGGNYNLRLEARAADGTRFTQRIIVEMEE